MIEFVFCEKRDEDNNFEWEHEDALPPAVETNWSEVDELVGEGAEGGNGSQNPDTFKNFCIRKSGDSFSYFWNKKIADEREEGGSTEEEDEY